MFEPARVEHLLAQTLCISRRM